MFVSACLKRNGIVLGENVQFKKNGTYTVSAEHCGIVGTTLAVIAGPHKDYSDINIFTVELLDPPENVKDLPFFNSEYITGWEYCTIHVE